MTATLAAPATTLTKAQLKKLDTFGFHEPREFDPEEADNFAVISIYQNVLNKAGTDLKTAPVGKVRFRRRDTAVAVKEAKRIVKSLNAGVEATTLFPLLATSGVFSVNARA